MGKTTNSKDEKLKQIDTQPELQQRKIVKAKRILRKVSKDNPNIKSTHSQSTDKTTIKASKFKKSASPNFEIKNLSKKLSPSLTSLEGEDAKFNCSNESLQPTTNGNSQRVKRRTYELEDSIIDVSILKSASKIDASRINSSSSTQSETPTDFSNSKVTFRRKRWSKAVASPHFMFKSLDDSLSAQKNTLIKKSPPKKNFVSRIKVPNFNAIHQKALEKAENIAEYQERKNLRAKMLLSGNKPKSRNEKNSEIKQSKKHLKFASSVSDKDLSPTYIPLPSTPFPKHLKQKTPNFSVEKIKTIFSVKNIESPKFLMKQISTSKDIKPFCFGAKKIISPIIKQNNQSNCFKMRNENKPTEILKNKFMLNGVKSEEIKAIATKSKPVKNGLDERRCLIKGVRSNRRFDLLMNMRKGIK